jgi:large subunit ribosomal protein L10
MKRSEKTFFVQNLVEELKGASSVVLVDFSGLNVKAQQELKKRLREVNAKMLVVKNTLFKLALDQSKIDKDDGLPRDEVLRGPTALVITEAEPIAPLQVLGKFAEEFEIPQLKVGIIEGTFQDTQTLITLSKLPSKEVLEGLAVSAIGAPIYGLLNVLQTNVQKLIYILNEKAKSHA